MAALTVSAAQVAFGDNDIWLEKLVGPAGEALSAGHMVRYSLTTGKFMLANATAAAEARACGMAMKTADLANVTITVIRKGLVDCGAAFGSLTYDDDIYLSETDGSITTTASGLTVTKLVGIVQPVFGYTTADKLLRINV